MTHRDDMVIVSDKTSGFRSWKWDVPETIEKQGSRKSKRQRMIQTKKAAAMRRSRRMLPTSKRLLERNRQSWTHRTTHSVREYPSRRWFIGQSTRRDEDAREYAQNLEEFVANRRSPWNTKKRGTQLGKIGARCNCYGRRVSEIGGCPASTLKCTVKYLRLSPDTRPIALVKVIMEAIGAIVTARFCDENDANIAEMEEILRLIMHIKENGIDEEIGETTDEEDDVSTENATATMTESSGQSQETSDGGTHEVGEGAEAETSTYDEGGGIPYTGSRHPTLIQMLKSRTIPMRVPTALV